MIFPVNVPERTPSPRTQELAQRLSLAIAEFQQRNPDVSAEEVRVAAQIATGQVSTRRRAAPGALFAAVAAAVVLGGFLFSSQGAPGGAQVPWVAITAGAIAVIAIVAALRNRS